MAETDDNPPVAGESVPVSEPLPGSGRRWARSWQIVAAIGIAVLLALVGLWSQRERIADNVIARELKSRGIPATYKVQRIGGRRQVLRDVVVGNPARPDLTVERAEVRIRYTLGWPTIGRITLTRPRLYATYRRGTLSFGSLDPLIFREPTARKFELPDLDLRVVDGRALLASDFGPVGFKAEGSGNLRNGFAGIVAVAAPRLAGEGCVADQASYYGRLAIADKRPRVAGPLRLGSLGCPGRRLSLAQVTANVSANLDEAIRSGEGAVKLASGAFTLGDNRAAGLAGDLRLAYRDGTLTTRIEARASGLATPALSLASLTTEGTFRARDHFARLEYQGSVGGVGVTPGPGFANALAAAARSARGTLLAPLVAQAAAALQREGRGSRLAAEIDYDRAGQRYTLVVPQARLQGGSGAVLLDVSRLEIAGVDAAAPRLAGNFATGGPGLPRIVGRMERAVGYGGGSRSVLHLAMAEYRAGDAALALPQLVLAQGADGAIGFVGAARASGPLPNGFTRNLIVPIEGRLSSGGQLDLFRRCTAVRFDQLALANLVLERRGLTLCPQRGAPIIRAGRGDLRVAFGTPSLDLAGRLGKSQVRIVSGPVGFAYPGVLTATGVGVALGPADKANIFGVARLRADVGKVVDGTFAGAHVKLFATPLDISDAAGRWRFAAGRLTLSDTSMRVTDRASPARFEPLVARGATLTLANNRIVANAELREPQSGRAITRALIEHDVTAGRGHADLFIDELRFDQQVQPGTISRLALGNIANARGTVRGTGRIDWSPRGVTSTGTFSTDSLDFAAAFGPVRGLAGTVRFTDLLGMVTAPDQEVRVASVNPGIEVTDGVVRFQLLSGGVFRLASATWPFLGGTISLAPTDLRLGVAEPRRYTLVIVGLDSARFIERMGLENISATGIFDGRLPLVFGASASGEQVGSALGTILGAGTPEGMQAAAATPGSGRIEGGLLESRPPGGNVSYVGDLSKRNLSTIANFAFDTLRSLDYQHMTIQLNGALEGEIVTRVRFDGVRQGAGAKRNILTRAVADLPIRFILNVRAPFYQLINSMKALYDKAFVKDPRMLGLADEQGRPLPQAPRESPRQAPRPGPRAEPDIHPSESEIVR